MVMGVPESGVPAAEGFARASGIPYGQGLVKNRYIGRTFIAPDQQERADAVRRKLNPLSETIAGKRLVVVDDSIVRGTTQRSVIRMLREAGAAEVHLRISSPPWRWPCFYGIDTPSYEELLATDHTVEEMAEILGADSLAYISIENLKEAIGADGGFCDACFTGDYPTPVPVAARGAGQPRAGRAGGAASGPPGRAARGLSTSPRSRAAPPTPAPASTSPPATPRSSACAPWWRASAASAACSPSTWPATRTRCWWPPPTGWAPSWWWPGPPAATTRSASTWWPCASTTWSASGAEPLFMLDYIATGKVDPEHVATVVAGVHEGCRQAGCALIGGETAEHAGVMAADELDLAGFAVGVVEQGTQLGPERVRPGDAVVGLPSPGLRSNGYTLARHVLLERAGLEPGGPGLAGRRTTAWPTSCCARR